VLTTLCNPGAASPGRISDFAVLTGSPSKTPAFTGDLTENATLAVRSKELNLSCFVGQLASMLDIDDLLL
jgi:hypothetical protein